MKNKRGFIMWGDFIKGFVFGLLVGMAVVAMAMWGLIPLPFEICALCG